MGRRGYAGCQDTWISDNPYEGGDFSRQQTLQVGSKRNIMIRFELADIPKDNVIQRGVLSLWDVGYPRRVKDRFPVTMEYYRVAAEWKESASWREYARTSPKEPGATTKPWKSAGGDWDSETDYGQPAKGLIAVDAHAA